MRTPQYHLGVILTNSFKVEYNISIMTFKTSLDRLAKGITLGVTLLFAAIIIMFYLPIKDGGKTIPGLVTIGLILIYLIVFAFRPKNYSLTNEKLIIHRPLRNAEISRAIIRRVEQIGKEKLRWSFRTFGVGGLFGYFGKFANSKMGRMTWYATRRDKVVLITTNENKKIVLTPDDPKGFVDCYNK